MAEIVRRRIADATTEEARTSWSRLTAATGVAAIVSVVASAAIYAGALAAGLVDTRVILPSLLGMGPLSLASVSLTALVASLAAGVVLVALAAMTRRPIRTFRVVSTVVALASLAMPATIPGPPPGMRLVMGAMHVAVWVVSVGLLATLAERWARRSA
jgi:hypothetical protein